MKSVMSFFQSGGITANTVHLGAPKRNVGDPTLKNELEAAIHQLDPTRTVSIGYGLSDEEAAQFAAQIGYMLEMQGGKVEMAAWAVSAPTPGLQVYADTNMIFVGPRSAT